MKRRSLALVLVLVALACSGPAGKSSPSALLSSSSSSSAVSPSASILAHAKVSALLPADTLFLAVAKSPQGLARDLDLVQALKAQGDGYEKSMAEVVRETGVNLLDPKNLTELGLDPDAPFGMALLPGSKNDPVFLMFATVTDAEKFKTFVYRSRALSKMRFEAKSQGHALVLVPERDKHTAFMLRGDQLFLVVADRSRDREPALVQLGAVTRKTSLASSSRFRQVVSHLGFGLKIAAFVGFDTFIEREIERMQERQRTDEPVARAERELAAARQRGADQRTIDRLAQRIEDQRRWSDRRRRRFRGQRALMERLLVALGPVAVGLELDGRALHAKAFFAPEPRSLADLLVAQKGGPLVALRATEKAPVFALAMHTDPDAVMELAGVVLEADGDSLDELRDQLRKLLGIDLDRDLVSLLSGEFGVSVTAGDWSSMLASPDAALAGMGVHFVVGIKDAAATKELLQKVASKWLSFRRPGGHGPKVAAVSVGSDGSLTVPFWLGKHLRIEVAGNYLVASTADAAKRIVDGAPSFAKALDEPQRSLLLDDNAHVAFSSEWAMIGAWFLMNVDAAMDERAAMATAAAPTTPTSKEYLAKEKEVRALRAEQQEHNRARRKRQQKRVSELIAAIGRSTWVAKRVDGGVAVYGGQFFGTGGTHGLVQRILNATLAPHERRRWELDDKLWAAEQELQRMREKMQQRGP